MIEHLNQSTFDKEEPAELESKIQKDLPEISFHVISRANHPQKIQVIGKLKKKSVTVLKDGASTYNFIDKAILTK